MYVKKRIKTKQLTLLPRLGDRFHRLSDEIRNTLQFLKVEKVTAQIGEQINTLAEKIHERVPFSKIAVNPGNTTGECLYKITFSDLYDTNIVDDGESNIKGQVILYLGSFITFGSKKHIETCDPKEVTHAVIIDGNGDAYTFSTWKECLRFFFEKYKIAPQIPAKKTEILPKSFQ